VFCPQIDMTAPSTVEKSIVMSSRGRPNMLVSYP
jgi:hypothetical protein